LWRKHFKEKKGGKKWEKPCQKLSEIRLGSSAKKKILEKRKAWENSGKGELQDSNRMKFEKGVRKRDERRPTKKLRERNT